MKHTIKATDGTTIEVEDYTRATAIKAFCYECLGWSGDPKADCTSATCTLYPFRGLSLVASHIKAAANRASSLSPPKHPIGKALKSTNGGS